MYLVRTGILEQDNSALLQVQPRLLGNEQVGTFNDVLEVGLSVVVNQARNIGDVNSLGTERQHETEMFKILDRKHLPTTARHEDISLEPQVSIVPEVGTIGNNLSS